MLMYKTSINNHLLLKNNLEMYTSVVSVIADSMHFNPRAHSFNNNNNKKVDTPFLLSESNILKLHTSNFLLDNGSRAQI